MKIIKAFKFRLKPSVAVQAQLSRIAGSNRFIWNWALANQKKRLDEKQYTENYASLCRSLAEIKNGESTAWLNECPSQTLQQSLKNLARAFSDAFSKKTAKKFPQFKKKGQHDSFRYPQGIKIDGNQVFLPKIGWVRFFKSQAVAGSIK